MEDNREKPNVQYERMSLRHEHVENEKLPKICIYYATGSEDRAVQISYGVEEEGLPRYIQESDTPLDDALANTLKKGLGVAVGVDAHTARIFCRQFKKKEAFLHYDGIADESLRMVGKNSARILKHKPFILEEEKS